MILTETSPNRANSWINASRILESDTLEFRFATQRILYGRDLADGGGNLAGGASLSR